jgi:hypothetical protein
MGIRRYKLIFLLYFFFFSLLILSAFLECTRKYYFLGEQNASRLVRYGCDEGGAGGCSSKLGL